MSWYTPLLGAGSTLGLPLVGATSWSTPLMRAGSISEASNGKLPWFRDGFRPNCYRESTELGLPAGRRVRFGSFPVAVRPKSGLEGRFTARMHYCTTSSPCLRRNQISKEPAVFPFFQWRPEQPSMLKAKAPKTTSSTLINYAKVLRSQSRTSVDVQPSRAKCEPGVATHQHKTNSLTWTSREVFLFCTTLHA